jgi:hypothetical protein
MGERRHVSVVLGIAINAAAWSSEAEPAATIWNPQSPGSLLRVLQDRGPENETRLERPALRMPPGYCVIPCIAR